MWPNLHFLADLVTLTEETLSGKLHFLCNNFSQSRMWLTSETCHYPNKKTILKVSNRNTERKENNMFKVRNKDHENITEVSILVFEWGNVFWDEGFTFNVVNESFFKERKNTSKRWEFKTGHTLQKKLFYFLQWKSFKNCKTCFLFQLESYFHS